MAEIMLTTIDNPYDPFTQWDDWLAWDEQAGYYTNAYLARIARTSDELSETDQEQALELAMDEILKENITGTYIKVSKSL